MKNRLCIFSFYDKEGYVDDYIAYLLQELSTCINRLIVVVNGALDNRGREIFERFTDEIYIRDNVGFDAGAYKDVLCYKLSQEEIQAYDEIVLCNDTFYGPFVPMKDIFDKMENTDCDMWGLNGYFNWIFPHLQSYFVVFRERIITDNLLLDYFYKNVDENTVNINHVYCQFENGLYDYMVRQKGMTCVQYVEDNHNYDLYNYSYGYLKELRFPILKKKVFSVREFEKENTLCTLSYIKYNTKYDINLILNNVERTYDITISEQDIKNISEYKKPERKNLIEQINDVVDVEKFIEGNEFYIYGAGTYACNTYWRFARDNEKFLGFIVSDDSKDANTILFGHTVQKMSDIDNICSKRIILAMKAEFAEEVLRQFKDTSNIIRIF